MRITLTVVALAMVLSLSACGRSKSRDEIDPVSNQYDKAEMDKAIAQAGFYLILAEAQGAEGLPKPSPDQQIARYDQKYLREAESQSPRYLLLRKRPDIALKLARPPESAKDSRGFTVLTMELTRDAATNLEQFTRGNLGRKVAFVIEGEVVTIHKVRSVITGNQFQLSRCTDNACEYIRARLTR